MRTPLLRIGGRGRRVSRNSALSLADTLLTILTYFLVMRQVVVTLGLDQLGLWSMALGYLAFLRMLDQGGAISVTRSVASAAENPDDQAGFADSSALLSITFFSVLAAIAFVPIDNLLQGSIDADLAPQARQLLLGLLTVLPLQMVALGQLAVLDGIGRADLRVAINVAATVVYAILALVLLVDQGIMALVYAQAVQSVLAALAARLTLAMNCPAIGFLPVRFSLSYVRAMIGFGARLQIATIPMSLFDAFNRILIGRFAGLELLGLYDLAYKFAASARQIVQAALNPTMPEFARLLATDATAARRRFAAIAPVAIVAAGGVALVQLVAVPLASYVLLKRIDIDFILIATCLSFAWGVANIGLTSQLYARAAGTLRWAIIGQWLLLASGITLVMLAVSIFGGIRVLVAPAIAIALGHLITFAGENRQYGLNPLRGPWGTLVLATLSAVALMALALIAIVGTTIEHWA